MPLIQNAFHQYAFENHIDEISKIIASNEILDVNYQDPISGKTALHYAVANKNSSDSAKMNTVQYLLKEVNVDPKILDRSGFSWIDRYLALGNNDDVDLQGEAAIQENKTITRRVVRQISETFSLNLHYVVDVKEIPLILNDLEGEKFGFILETPNIYKNSAMDRHVVPIYVEKRDNEIVYFMLDSAYKSFIPLLSSTTEIKSTIFFNPFPLQASNSGCFEGGVRFLLHCFNNDTMYEFCISHSSSVKLTDLQEYTSEAKSQMADYDSIIRTRMDRVSIHQNKMKQYMKLSDPSNQTDNSLIKNIHIITKLFPWMLMYIEHYKIAETFLKMSEYKLILKRIQSCFPERLKKRTNFNSDFFASNNWNTYCYAEHCNKLEQELPSLMEEITHIQRELPNELLLLRPSRVIYEDDCNEKRSRRSQSL